MKIAILPGDGIGPEIVARGAQGPRRAAPRRPRDRDRERADRRRRLRRGGASAARRDARAGAGADAVLFGAVGGPHYDALPRALRPEQGILGIRKALGLFANLRPALVYPELAAASTLKPEVVAGPRHRDRARADRRHLLRRSRVAAARMRPASAKASTRCATASPRSARIARVGFEIGAQAQRQALLGRQGQRARDVDPVARGRYRVGRDYPDVELVAHVRRQRGDAARPQPEAVRRHRHRQHVRRHPLRRGVDARRLDRHAAFGFARREQQGSYEPIHGSAPDIAGQDIANPLATILSLAMMFRYTFARADIAERIEDAVRKTLGRGFRTGRHRSARARPSSGRARWATRSCRRFETVVSTAGHPVVVRRAEPGDADGIYATFLGRRAIAGTLQLPFPSVRDVAQTHGRMSCRRTICWWRPSTGTIVGNLGLHAASKSARRRHVGDVGMAVRDDRQRRGVGTALMQAAIELADGWLNYQRLELSVYTDNLAALALYRKFGFAIEGTCARLCVSRRRVCRCVHHGAPHPAPAAIDASRYIMMADETRTRGIANDAVGFVGWRGMVGSVLMQRMRRREGFRADRARLLLDFQRRRDRPCDR